MSDHRYDRFVDRLRQVREDIRGEVQRLVTDIRDPEKQQRVKESLREVSTWARHTAEDVADTVEKAIRKAEGALTDAAKRVGVPVPKKKEANHAEWTPLAHDDSPVVFPKETEQSAAAAPGPSRPRRQRASKPKTTAKRKTARTRVRRPPKT